jgi:hypothetical protein
VSPPTLDQAALNRATLARQHLLERTDMDAEGMVRHLVGLQAQEPQSWYISLWARLRDFDAAATGRLIEERRLVRLTLMRGTVHLATADDAPVLRAFVQPVIDRYVRGAYARRLGELDLRDLEAEVRRLTAEPRPMSELAAALAERWPSAERSQLSIAAKVVVPLVQVPPRAVWRHPGGVRLTPVERWLSTRVPDGVDAAALVRRYLGAFGPASVADAQTWSGLTRLREVFDSLRPELVTFRDRAGRELFDLPDAPRPAPDTPAATRFLADYDNVLLSHADRTRFAGDVDPEALAYVEGPYPSALLVDGRYVGQWYLERARDRVTLTIKVGRPLTAPEEAAVRGEAAALVRFLVSKVEPPTIDIRIVPATPFTPPRRSRR